MTPQALSQVNEWSGFNESMADTADTNAFVWLDEISTEPDEDNESHETDTLENESTPTDTNALFG